MSLPWLVPSCDKLLTVATEVETTSLTAVSYGATRKVLLLENPKTVDLT